MDTRRLALFRRGMFFSAACVMGGVYVGMPAGFVDAFGKLGAQAQTPLETLAVEQVKVDADQMAPVRRESGARELARNPSHSDSARDAAPLRPLRAPHGQPSGSMQGEPRHQGIWESKDASAARATGRDAHERTPGVVRKIRYEDFKHWT
ncbi:hypothetical protein QYH69_06880 [Paraburkholderia sp. SARCC-3016]|uniref:hypothetical protein n=1 Tax=Paraburkholderia sp. SARCC-3016 TaxID=3058611 RepID=UPI00280778F5|nr:hypothetical protein [Paraburkholderia sp. SARCC-3016]MDQ7976968.1 hypothetical protein [Paraburkholderia sp. SARCC-3016]